MVGYEFGLRCPDGAVWPDLPRDLPQARHWLLDADSACGCEESPHVIVRRPIEDWESVPGDSDSEN